MGTAITATLAGQPIVVDPAALPEMLAASSPEALHIHWVKIDGVRWPPKQVVHAITGRPRREYTSHEALRVLEMAGLATSSWRGIRKAARATASSAAETATATVTPSPDPLPQHPPVITELFDAVETLAEFLTTQDLTTRLADLEHQMHDASREHVRAATREAGLDLDALLAAVQVRHSLGRMSDVVHATAIALTLEQIMVDGERLTARPSLAAGNDPARRYDVETNRRVAEFKLSGWRGADTMRKRGTAKDLIHLAMDEEHDHRQLFVVGPKPEHYLTTSRSTVEWNLGRASISQRETITERFGAQAMAMTISAFRTTHATHVEIVDLTQHLPELKDWLEML